MAKKRKDPMEKVKEQLDDIKKLLDIGLKEKAAEKLLKFLKEIPDLTLDLYNSLSSFFKDLSEDDLHFFLKVIDYYFEEKSIFYFSKITILGNLKENKENTLKVAFELVEKAEKKFPQISFFAYKKVALKIDSKEYETALDYLELHFKDRDKTKIYYLKNKIQLLGLSGDPDLAFKTLEYAIGLFPKNIDFIIMNIAYYIENKKNDIALETVDNAIKYNKGDDRIIELFKKKIEIYSILGDFDSKLKTVDEALRIEPHNIDLMNIKVYSLAGEHLYKEALNIVDSAIDNIGRHINLLYLKSFLFYNKEDYSKALELINEILLYEPRNSAFLNSKIYILFMIGEIDLAETMLNSVLENGLINPELYEMKSRIHFKNEQLDEALEAINKAIEMDRNSLNLFRSKIIILFRKGDTDSANEKMDKVQKFEKDVVLLGLKAISFTTIKQYKKSNNICNAALEYAINEEQKARLFSNISLNYFGLKNYNKSIEFVDKALLSEENSTSYNKQKFMIYLVTKRMEEAFDLFNDFCTKTHDEKEIFTICETIFENANDIFYSDRETSRRLYHFLEDSHYIDSEDKDFINLKKMIRNNLIAIEINGEILSFGETDTDPLRPKLEDIIEETFIKGFLKKKSFSF